MYKLVASFCALALVLASQAARAQKEESPVISGFCGEIRNQLRDEFQDGTKRMGSAIEGAFNSARNQLSYKLLSTLEGAKKQDVNLEHFYSVIKRLESSSKEKLAALESASKEKLAALKSGQLEKDAMVAYEQANQYLSERQKSLGRKLQEHPLTGQLLLNGARRASESLQNRFRSLKRDAGERVDQWTRSTCTHVLDYQSKIAARYEELAREHAELPEFQAAVFEGRGECLPVVALMKSAQACSAAIDAAAAAASE